ncbi:MAG: VRR-NUC domain-containing protein [Candidatus Goldbacteria bacterium]|nr:VRR-NUC domain-containing protein [Candidatus Goldiibacteriota bacterium]
MKLIYEKDIQRDILSFLRLNKIFCWKNNNVGIYKKETGSYIPSQIQGISDIIGILPDGRFLAIEIKREGGKLTDKQIEFLNNIKKNNGLTIIAYSVKDVVEKLQEQGYLK